MNKLKSIVLAIILTLSFAACSQKSDQTDVTPEQPLQTESSQDSSIAENEPKVESSQDSSVDENEPKVESEKVEVADAAMYRGTIVSMEDTDDGKQITLEQAEGTNFGAPKLNFLLTENTTSSFEESELATGKYLEVFYGLAEDETLDSEKLYSVIGANLYPEADIVNFNGIIKEFKTDETKENEGTILMEDSKTNQEVLFHYSNDTNFYLDPTQLKQGDEINIFHSGIFTRSLPPQGSALEIRTYEK